MRTPSHALLTRALSRLAGHGHTSAAVVGSVFPDAPVALGAAWLLARRASPFGREEFETAVCSRTVFRGPDAALHSALPVGAALAAFGLSRGSAGAPLAFVLGWAGHVLVDALTHAGDARPVLWPLSSRRFRSPVSYWEHDRHARLISILDYALLVQGASELLRRGSGRV